MEQKQVTKIGGQAMTYKIFVGGQFVGETVLTESEVRAYNTLDGVTITRA